MARLRESDDGVPERLAERIEALLDRYVDLLEPEPARELSEAMAAGVVSAHPMLGEDGEPWVSVDLTTLDGGVESVLEVPMSQILP